MSKYQPGKENSRNNDFYLLKLSGIFDKVYNDALYNLFYFLNKKPLEL